MKCYKIIVLKLRYFRDSLQNVFGIARFVTPPKPPSPSPAHSNGIIIIGINDNIICGILIVIDKITTNIVLIRKITRYICVVQQYEHKL